MPSIMRTAGLLAGLAAIATALPALPKLTARQEKIYELTKRQSAAEKALGLQDVDILQFALTLEWLEGTFYQQGFAKFKDSDFTAAGLSASQVADLKQVGMTELEHVKLLQGAIAQAGVKPVQPCTYDFGFTDAKGMLATAGVLENVGVSAYLGAAPILSDPGILATAGSILTIEARHQTFIRGASGATAIAQAFDTPLGPKAVFSLAAPFIKSCPDGSNLILTAFPALKMTSTPAPAAAGQVLAAGTGLKLQSDASANAKFCGFTNSNAPGGTAFTPFSNGNCATPPNLAGITYLTLTSEAPASGVLTDAMTLAGPMVIQIS